MKHAAGNHASQSGTSLHSGGCHCGAVRFQFDSPAIVTVYACNCSICAMTGFEHLIVPESDFRLLQGEDTLTEYRFGSGIARHFFCRRCGVKSFYVPRSNPDGISIHARCVDPSTFTDIQVQPFDGQNWEQNAADLSHLA